MHYFKRNIGDYAKKAGRLSMLEHGAYTLLLDACYDREEFPSEQEAIDWCWARTDAEIGAVKFVLSKFFTLQDGKYIQNRVHEEIEAYRAKAEKNSEIAREREQKRKSVSRVVHETCTDDHEAPPNQEPLTINHKPKETKTKPRAVGADVFPEVEDRKLVADWLKVRKEKRLALTETALNGFMREVRKAGLPLETVLKKCCEKGWGSFEAQWLERDFGPPKRTERFDPVAFVNRNAKKPMEFYEKVIEH